ncbi:sensor histidine kinase [Oerskovia flava]|uniref:sensor histidine kinase n=1 Tax=Oerskovia flava TaxID=2986422 RepID=UPI00224004BE|nr:HAMP domain-containing sensor histidine kinase [Oerskovia sp. JB1-3-2]
MTTEPTRRVLTVRTRILAAVLTLSALALVIAGATAYTLQRHRVDDRIEETLNRSVLELKQLALTGVNPVTGEPFDSPEDVVVAAIQLTVPAGNEGIIGLRSGRSPLVSQQDVQLRLEDDEALVAELTALVDSDHVVLRTVTTPTASYRAMVFPVRADGGTATTTGDAASVDTAPAALVLAFDRDAEHAEFNEVFATYALVALVALVLIGVVGWVVAGRLLRPIRVLAQTAQQIGDTDLSQRIGVSGNDDLSELTRAFNAMLARLDESFESQRRLLDDVGHELRTPLTVVRGHLELMDPADVEDTTATRDLALDELDRMNRLVDDLVILATAGRPDFVRPTEVDLGRLTDDVLDKARTLGDRRWLVDARTDATARVDAQRITQAWLQLAANAVKFSAPGSTVALGSRVSDDGAHLTLWVRDEGVGIEPADLERIFERFARAEHGIEARDGAGLGLAIVTAIAAGHDGRVDVASVRGAGSTFTLVLPVVASTPAVDAPPAPPSALRTAPTAATAPSAPTPPLPPPGRTAP